MRSNGQRTERAFAAILLSAALLAAGALGVTACGGAAGGEETTSGGEGARELALEHARCMRDHGVDVPDPSFQADGGVERSGPEDEVSSAKVRDALEACEKYQTSEESEELSDEELEEYKKAALAHARCMRENGLEDFPDPKFEDGAPELLIDKASGVDEDPDFRNALEACRDALPKEPAQ